MKNAERLLYEKKTVNIGLRLLKNFWEKKLFLIGQVMGSPGRKFFVGRSVVNRLKRKDKAKIALPVCSGLATCSFVSQYNSAKNQFRHKADEISLTRQREISAINFSFKTRSLLCVANLTSSSTL